MGINLGKWFYFGFKRKYTGRTGWYLTLRISKYQLMYHSWLISRSWKPQREYSVFTYEPLSSYVFGRFTLMKM